MSEVATLRFEGVVDAERYGNPERVLVGDVSVLAAIQEVTQYRERHMIVQIESADVASSFEGKGTVDVGMTGYSSLTPGENALFYVGEYDLLEKLIGLEGKQIILTVAVG